MTSDTRTVLFQDDFRSGFDLTDRWALLEAPPSFVADDGDVVTSSAGLTVTSKGRNAKTGKPEMTKVELGVPGHLKWLAMTTEAFEATGTTRFAYRAGAEVFGVDEHPYGDAVTDPQSDLRLGAVTLNVADFASGLVFDFWITNTAIYPFYERLKFPGDPRPYQNFGSVGPGVPRRPGDMHDFVIAYDAPSARVTWEVDGRVVASVEGVGAPAPGWTVVLNHGGTPEPVTPERFQVGMGILTLLDAVMPPDEKGLVDVGTEHVPPREYHGGPQLFGQGVELRLDHVSVERD